MKSCLATACSRRTWSLKGFGQCDEDGLDISKRVSDFDEYSMFKEEPAGDEEVPPVYEEKGCLPSLFRHGCQMAIAGF